MKKVLRNFLFCIFSIISLQTFAQWQEIMKTVASDRAPSKQNVSYGSSVAISGNYAIVGANFEDEDENGANSMQAAGAAYFLERDVNGIWSEVQKVAAPSREAFDNFGIDVSISGNYAIVGAHNEDEDAAEGSTLMNAGSAYIYERNGAGVWVLKQKIVDSERSTTDAFGFSVSISGNYAVVGSYLDDQDAGGLNDLVNAGSATVFIRDGAGNWNEQQRLTPNERIDQDQFGFSVSIDGSTIVVGALLEDENANGNAFRNGAGSAFIYELSGGVWAETQKIVASDRAANREFGIDVAISGNNIIVGAHQENRAAGEPNRADAGAVYFYEKNGATWSEVNKVTASDRATDTFFGSHVTISGGQAIVGQNNFSNEAVYIIQKNATTAMWEETQRLTAGNSSNNSGYGNAVGISGSSAIVGAQFDNLDENSANSINGAGSAYFLTNCMPITSMVNETACDSFVSPSMRYVYTTSGTYMDTLYFGSVNLCDSIITINLIVNNTSTSTLDTSVCSTYTSPAGRVLTMAGTYTDTLFAANALGCDSVITINLSLNQSFSTIAPTVCESYTSPSGNDTYTVSGMYVDTLIAANQFGCDSIITIDLTINNFSTSVLNDSICFEYTGPSGTVYTASGTYSDTLFGANQFGCDSIITLNLIDYTPAAKVVDISVCKDYISPSGNIYTMPGTYRDTLFGANFQGCDSIIITNLSFFTAPAAIIDTSACRAYTSPSGLVFTTAGTYQDTLFGANVLGCDSIITINLSFFTSPPVTIDTMVCNIYTAANGATYTKSGIYQDTLFGANVLGCDSIIISRVNVFNPKSQIDTAVCETYTSPSGKIFIKTGIYKDTLFLSSFLGCDSVITINLEVLNKTETIFATACDSYTAPSGMIYTSSGTYIDKVIGVTSTGCDSVYTINLSLNNSSSSTQSIQACQSYILPSGLSVTENGTYVDTISNAVGCDSVITTILSIEKSLASIDTTVCLSYTTPTGSVFDKTGFYTEVVKNAAPGGCDSTYFINLVVNGSRSLQSVKACQEFVSATGKVFTTPGTHTDTLVGANVLGCDSVITYDLNLTVLDTNINVINGGSALESAANADVYLWYNCDTQDTLYNQTQKVFLPITNGNYATLLFKGECEAVSQCAVVTTVGVNDLEFIQNITITPNPSSSFININVKPFNPNQSFKLYSVTGKMLIERKLISERTNVDLSMYNAGLYFLIINDKSFKIIKE